MKEQKEMELKEIIKKKITNKKLKFGVLNNYCSIIALKLEVS